MRALGLPNTKHFHEITRIEDAIARASSPPPPLSLLVLSLPAYSPFPSSRAPAQYLTYLSRCHTVAEKLKQEGRAELSHAELTEELEDEEGNVYNRKTYEDLKRQGLV